MKHIIPLLIIVLGFIISCGKQGEKNEEVETPVTDTLPTALTDSAAADSMEIVEETPPQAADELFDDFIYAFMRSKKFQQSRIAFPLPTNRAGSDSIIEEEAWNFEPLYSQQEFYTMLFNTRKAMDMEKDTSICHVTVEWIDLDIDQVKEYNFNRSQGAWRLDSLHYHSVGNNANNDFYAFYKNFTADSLFQRKHIAEQLVFNTYDEENFEDITGVLDVEQWFAFRPILPTAILTNIIYGERPFNSVERYFVISSLSGGMSCTLHFKRQGDDWLLVEYDN